MAKKKTYKKTLEQALWTQIIPSNTQYTSVPQLNQPVQVTAKVIPSTKKRSPWSKLNVATNRRNAALAKKRKAKAEAAEKFSPLITDNNRQNKKWLRSELTKKYRVWKNGKFLAKNVFLTGLGSNKKAPCMYHICFETETIIVYARVIKDGPDWTTCEECEWKVTDDIKMLLRLQNLKKAR